MKTVAELKAELDVLDRLVAAELHGHQTFWSDKGAKIAAQAATDALIEHLEPWAIFPAQFELFRGQIDDYLERLGASVAELRATGKPYHHLRHHPADVDLRSCREALRSMAAVHPNLTFLIEVRLYRMGVANPGNSLLRNALQRLMELVREKLNKELEKLSKERDAQIEADKKKRISERNRRTGPRKPPAHCRGYYWDAAGLLQYDDARQGQLRLDCTKENAQAAIEYFERSRGRTRGAKAFAMTLLGIKHARTFDALFEECASATECAVE